MKRIIKFLKNNKRGSEVLTTPLIIAIGILFVAILIAFSIQIITPYIWYEKLSSTCLKYVFVMEEYGYLTSIEKNYLEKELIEQGFEKKNLTISCSSKRQMYGNPIYLSVNYNYIVNLPIIGERTIPMNITRESVSKR